MVSGIPHNQLELQISLSEYMWLVLESFNQQSGRGIMWQTTAPKNSSLRKKREMKVKMYLVNHLRL